MARLEVKEALKEDKHLKQKNHFISSKTISPTAILTCWQFGRQTFVEYNVWSTLRRLCLLVNYYLVDKSVSIKWRSVKMVSAKRRETRKNFIKTF